MQRTDVLNGTPVPDWATVAELRQRLRPAGPEAWAACVALGRNSTPEALDVLVELANDPDWRYRRIAVEVIGAHSLATHCSAQVLGALRDPSPFVVRTACECAARLGLVEARNVIVELLRARSASTRQVAVESLALLWSDSDFDLPAKP